MRVRGTPSVPSTALAIEPNVAHAHTTRKAEATGGSRSKSPRDAEGECERLRQRLAFALSV